MTTKQWFSLLKWVIALVIVVLLFIFFRGCGNGSVKTTVKDTVKVEVVKTVEVIKTDTSYFPVPYKVVQTVTEYKTDTLETYEVRIDTLKTVKDYLATRYYRDSIPFKDSAGYAIVKDTVSQNKIIGRGVTSSVNKTTVTNTITLRDDPRTTFYLGMSAAGNKTTPVYSVGASAGLMFKNGKYYGITYELTRDGQPLYGMSIMLPIRLRKQ